MALFGALALLHVLAIYLGFYQGKTWVDMPVHAGAGLALGLTWVWILDYRASRGMVRPDFFMLAASLIGWVLLMSFV